MTINRISALRYTVLLMLATVSLANMISPASAQTRITLGPGQYPSLVVRPDGIPIVSAYNPVTQDLQLHICSDALCTNWTTTTLDETGNVGEFTSMVMNANGFPVIGYYDRTEGRPRLITCPNAACNVSPPLTLGDMTKPIATKATDIGQYLKIQMRSDGRPVAAYFDDTTNRLESARCGNASCSSGNTRYETDTTSAGEYLSLALGPSGNPVIAYYSLSSTALKLVVCGNPQCTIIVGTNPATIENSSDVGQYTSIQMGADGFPIIAYYDVSLGDLRLIDCGNQLCSTSVVTVIDQAGDVGRHTSMVLRNGLPVIAYQDVTNGDLKLAECEDTACQSRSIRTIDAGGTFAAPTGLYTSLALRPDGTPLVAYSSSDGSLFLLDLENQTPTVGLPNPYTSGSSTVEAGQLLSFTLMRTDADNFPVQTFAFSMFGSVPAGAALDPVTGAFTWTPTPAQYGTHTIVFVAADDGTPPKTAVATINLTVETTSLPPSLSAPVTMRVAEGVLLQFMVSATDPDAGDVVTLDAQDLPAGATFNAASGQFTWSPTSAQLGPHVVTFTATDGFNTPVSAQTMIWVDDQLAANGGFEHGNEWPDDWSLKKPNGDVYDCASPASEGVCAFTFTGTDLKKTSLKQTLDPQWIDIGDTLIFTMRVNAIKAITGRVGQVKVSYTDGTVEKLPIELSERTTIGWVTLSAPPTPITKMVQAIKIKLSYKGHKGSVSVDDVSLLVQSAGSDPTRADGVLSLPAVPGFRR